MLLLLFVCLFVCLFWGVLKGSPFVSVIQYLHTWGTHRKSLTFWGGGGGAGGGGGGRIFLVIVAYQSFINSLLVAFCLPGGILVYIMVSIIIFRSAACI